MVKIKNTQFCKENLKMERKKGEFFLPSGAGIRTPDFLKFPPMNWIIEGDELKCRQGS